MSLTINRFIFALGFLPADLLYADISGGYRLTRETTHYRKICVVLIIAVMALAAVMVTAQKAKAAETEVDSVRISGTVYDDRNGLPMSGATVTLT